MWSLTPLRGGIEPPAHRFGHPAASGRPFGRCEQVPRHRSALSWYLLSPLPPVRSGSPSSLRSSAALGVRRPAWGAGGRSDPQADRFGGLQRVAPPYGRCSLPLRQRPWRGGRTGRPRPTRTVRATYPLVITNDCRPTKPTTDRTHPTKYTCSDAFIPTYKPRSTVLAYNSSYFSIFVL